MKAESVVGVSGYDSNARSQQTVLFQIFSDVETGIADETLVAENALKTRSREVEGSAGLHHAGPMVEFRAGAVRAGVCKGR